MTATGLRGDLEVDPVRRRRKPAFRGDIEGLRGLAVVAVVLYHAHFGFSGGYVGVDVFFVLSGFLITGLIVDERGRSGSVGFGDFFARRIRRLLPASVVVFVATIVMSVMLMGPLQVIDLTTQAKWVALFASNIFFSTHATDYLQAEGVSPFQQYWSLAVEEQFYLVWPFLLAAVCAGVSTRRVLNRRIMIMLVVVVVASFALAVWWTGVRQPSAFFLLPARAWELGAGALLAVGLRSGLRVAPRIAMPLGWIGLVVTVAPMVLYSDTTVFPGWTALVPVLGTVMVLAAGSDHEERRRPPSLAAATLLATTVLRWFGRYSYSLYLWHWPLLVIFETRAGTDLPASQRGLIVGLSLILSVITFHTIENKVRFSPILVGNKPLAFASGALLLGVAVLSTQLLDTASIETGGPNSPDPAGVIAGGRSSFVPDDLVPPLDEVRDDKTVIYTNGCHHGLGKAETGSPGSVGDCLFGATDGPVVQLTGDSHAGHWFPALEAASLANGWILRSTTKSSCPLAMVTVRREELKRDYTECDLYRQAVISEMEEEPPALVVIAEKSQYYNEMLGEETWLTGLGATVARLSEVTEVVVLRDTPWAGHSVPNCLSVNLDDVRPCEFGVSEADEQLARRERVVVEQAGGHYLDPVSFVCPEGRCPVVVGNLLAFKDRHHLAPEFSRSLSGQLTELLDTAWDPTASSG